MSWPLDNWKGATAPTVQTIEGEYVRLEKLDQVKHGDDLWMAQCGPDSDPDQFRYFGVGPFASRQDFADFLRKQLAKADRINYAVVDKATGRAAGSMCYLRVRPEEGTIEVGENLGACMQRTRESTEARFLLLNNAFSLGFRRVDCRTSGENVRAQNAIARAGFELEGRAQKKYVDKGCAIDCLFYVIFSEDWKRVLKAAYQRWLSEENHTDGQQRAKLKELIEKARESENS